MLRGLPACPWLSHPCLWCPVWMVTHCTRCVYWACHAVFFLVTGDLDRGNILHFGRWVENITVFWSLNTFQNLVLVPQMPSRVIAWKLMHFSILKNLPNVSILQTFWCVTAETLALLVCSKLATLTLSDERDTVQKKTFTKWVNKHLVKVGFLTSDSAPCNNVYIHYYILWSTGGQKFSGCTRRWGHEICITCCQVHGLIVMYILQAAALYKYLL